MKDRLNIDPFENTILAESEDGTDTEEIEILDGTSVSKTLLEEVSNWKREAKSEDNDRYFFHVREVDQIERAGKYFVIGRKGSGKTAICEYFRSHRAHDTFSEKLSFKNFPFNELYAYPNSRYTAPNQFITIWKYVIYSTACRLMLKNEALDNDIREQLQKIFGDEQSLGRMIGKWMGKEFGISLLGLSIKMSREKNSSIEDWTERVNFLEDLLLQHGGDSKYLVLFDELDEDYRDIIEKKQRDQYTSLITSLFKAVQDIRSSFGNRTNSGPKISPVIFLRDDIYDLIMDSDKNKWGDFRVDLTWNSDKIKSVIAFRISRAIDLNCKSILTFPDAWARLFGRNLIRMGSKGRKKVGTFDFIARATLLRPRDFVAYLQQCAQHAIEQNTTITPNVIRRVDTGFSNYLRQELTDELFAVIPDISAVFDVISQLRKPNFSVSEFERVYNDQVRQGFIQEPNVKFVLQVLFLFSVIGNSPHPGNEIFRYKNREARLNFNEGLEVHRGLFKALQIR